MGSDERREQPRKKPPTPSDGIGNKKARKNRAES
ncbi:hypothetical protein M679_11280 [Neisseria gonorrhoeae SK7842]|nr:hypothetical protein M679_11280 [Neisseria gonorrhoeae SK7842]